MLPDYLLFLLLASSLIGHSMVPDYLLFLLLASFGVLQVAASHARLSGLSFFDRPLAGYLFGGATLVGAYWWFFTSTDRNVRSVEGAQQFGLFLGATAAALLATILIASILRRRLRPRVQRSRRGLEVLKEASYLNALVGRTTGGEEKPG